MTLPMFQAACDVLACCGDAQRFRLPCLHHVCGHCARRVLERPEARKPCPCCGEALDAPTLALLRECAPEAPDAPRLSTMSLQGLRDLRDALEALANDVGALAGGLQMLLGEAEDICQFVRENQDDVLRDIDAAFHGLAGCEHLHAPLRAEADARLRDEIALARSDVATVRALCASAAELAGRVAALMQAGVAACDLAPYERRLASLRARAGTLTGALDSVTYLACVWPVTPANAAHVHLARTLLWHDEHAYNRPAFTASGVAAYTRPVAATPDGRLFLVRGSGDGRLRDCRVVRTRAAAQISLDDAATIEFPEPRRFTRFCGDGLGRLWAWDDHAMCAWDADGVQRHDLRPGLLAQQWDASVRPDDAEFTDAIVAPSGVLVAQVILRGRGEYWVLGLARDMAPLWRHVSPAGAGEMSSGAFALREAVLLSRALAPAGRPRLLCLDAHTGRELAWDLGHETFAALDDGACFVYSLQRRALVHLVLAHERLAVMLGHGQTAGHAQGRVARVCDFLSTLLDPYHVVLGPHGAMYAEVDDGSGPRLMVL